jgi:DNA-binding transcriptional LysR family regulator
MNTSTTSNPAMDTQALEVFVTVARLGGFAAAARSRVVDPSSISRTVSGLEDELGVRLFQRSTRRLSLTEAGQAYLQRVASLVQELERAKEDALAVSQGVQGTLRMTASVAFGHQQLAPLLPAFRQAHPRLKLELVLTDTNLHLVDDRIDLAVRLGSRVEGDVVRSRLMATRYRVCASPAYLRQHGHPKTPEALAAHACVLLSLPEFRHIWRFRNARHLEHKVAVHGDVMLANPLVQLRCTVDGMGPALLADWLVAQAIHDGQLVDLFPRHQVTATSFDTGVWLLYPSRNYLPLKVRTMIDFLRQRLGSPRKR